MLAVDINPDAVRNTQTNIEKHHVEDKVEVRHGDVYTPLRENEKFDAIFWNTPFGLVEEEVPDLEKAVYDFGYKATERFVKEAKSHLKSGGKLFIGFSSTLGRLDLIQKFVDEAGFKMELLHEELSTEKHPVKFEIYEAS